MVKRTIRITKETDEQIRSAAKLRGYATPSVFLRAAIKRELGTDEGCATRAEGQATASVEQVRDELRRIKRGQQALFAFLDSFAKVMLTCLPEPTDDAMDAAVARARGRHARLLKATGQAMLGDSQLAMQDLVNHAER